MAWIPRGLIDELRRVGLDVREVPGCWGRGGSAFAPRGLIAHATAGSTGARDANELNVILNGSNTAPPPISQFMLGRTGIVYFVADGRCNHAVAGYAGTYFAGTGNSGLIGIEGCNDNRGESWAGSYAAYVLLVAVIVRWYGWPAEHVRGHKEHQPGNKSDPTFNMGAFRAEVAVKVAELAAGPTTPTITDQEESDMFVFSTDFDNDGNEGLIDDRWAHVHGGVWVEYDNQALGTALAKSLREGNDGAARNAVVLAGAEYDGLRKPYELADRVLSA